MNESTGCSSKISEALRCRDVDDGVELQMARRIDSTVRCVERGRRRRRAGEVPEIHHADVRALDLVLLDRGRERRLVLARDLAALLDVVTLSLFGVVLVLHLEDDRGSFRRCLRHVRTTLDSWRLGDSLVLAVALGTGWPHTPEQKGSIPLAATGSNARWEYIAL